MKKVSFVGIIGAVIFLASCATTVNYQVVRPAELDMNGANTISVLPFKSSRRSDIYIKPPKRGDRKDIFDFFYSYIEIKAEEADVIQYIQRELESGLAKSEYLKLVNSEDVETALRRGNASRIVDVYLTGEIINLDIDDETIVTRKVIEDKNAPDSGKKPVDEPKGGKKPVNDPKDGKIPIVEGKNQVIEEIKYKRHVYLNYLYEIIDAETDEVISYKQIEIRRSSSECNSVRSLPSAFNIIKYELDSNIKKILRSVQPYTINRSVSLMENKYEKEAFKVADRLIDNGRYFEAYEYYYKMYVNQGIFEAGYNAAILLEVMGDFDEAEDLMSELCLKTETSKQARKSNRALNDIRNEAKQFRRLENQLEDQAERAEYR